MACWETETAPSNQVSNIILGGGGSEQQSTILMGEVESSSRDKDRDALVVGQMENRE